MKTIVSFLIFLTALLYTSPFTPHSVLAAEETLVQRLSGRIVLQVESYGRAWYINPTDGTRYYMKDGAAAYEIMRSQSLGITDKDLAKIPDRQGKAGDTKLVERLKGKILLQVQQHGEAWYVNPTDGIRYYLKDGEVAYQLMRQFGLGISNDNLRKIPMNATQVVHDTTFNNYARVSYTEGHFKNGINADQILPLASLTKLMTALVFMDTNPNFDASYTLTADNILYPRLYVGNDSTSEVDFSVGDTVTINDLWAAMLVSSSNQAASAIADASGLSRPQFIARMNEKAKSLGLKKTVFHDVAGLDAHNVTTAKEMARIAAAAFGNKKIGDGTNMNGYTIEAVTSAGQEKTITVVNRNYSLLQFSPDASKTGFLIEAQRTAALIKNGTVYIVMHARSMSERNNALSAMIP